MAPQNRQMVLLGGLAAAALILAARISLAEISPQATGGGSRKKPQAKRSQVAFFVSTSIGGCSVVGLFLSPSYSARVGLRWRWLELEAQASFSTVDFKQLDMFFATAGISGYSLRLSRIRFRHGIHGGVERTRDYKATVTPYFYANVLTVSVRLVDGLWLEASNVNVGYPPPTFLAHVGLRWEH